MGESIEKKKNTRKGKIDHYCPPSNSPKPTANLFITFDSKNSKLGQFLAFLF